VLSKDRTAEQSRTESAASDSRAAIRKRFLVTICDGTRSTIFITIPVAGIVVTLGQFTFPCAVRQMPEEVHPNRSDRYRPPGQPWKQKPGNWVAIRNRRNSRCKPAELAVGRRQ
jgi:hypothetical protein